MTFFLDMAKIGQMTKLKEHSYRTILHGVVKFKDGTYRSLSDDTIITSSSDKKDIVCIKRISTNCFNKESIYGESSCRARV